MAPEEEEITPAGFRQELATGMMTQELDVGMIPWTVVQIERLTSWGVDGLISDYPGRVRQAMARRGMAPPR